MSLLFKGTFKLEVEESGLVVARRSFLNGLTQTAIHNLFDIYFNNGSTAAAWYIGLINLTDFDALDDENDVMSSHSGWTEITTEYNEATRPAWGPDAAASQTIANSAKATFTFNTATDIKGALIVSENTKGGATGLLWSTGTLDTNQLVNPGQTAKVYYSLSGQEG